METTDGNNSGDWENERRRLESLVVIIIVIWAQSEPHLNHSTRSISAWDLDSSETLLTMRRTPSPLQTWHKPLLHWLFLFHASLAWLSHLRRSLICALFWMLLCRYTGKRTFKKKQKIWIFLALPQIFHIGQNYSQVQPVACSLPMFHLRFYIYDPRPICVIMLIFP